jgi:hypothetical protein
MITDETQIKMGVKDYSLQPVTEHILSAAFEVHNVVGFGYLINFGRERVEYKRMVF